MKREHTTQSNSLLDWLKSKNCILYSPLSQNDTTDNILILWLLAAAISIVLFVSLAHTPKVSAPTMQWQADSSWAKGGKFSIKN